MYSAMDALVLNLPIFLCLLPDRLYLSNLRCHTLTRLLWVYLVTSLNNLIHKINCYAPQNIMHTDAEAMH